MASSKAKSKKRAKAINSTTATTPTTTTEIAGSESAPLSDSILPPESLFDFEDGEGVGGDALVEALTELVRAALFRVEEDWEGRLYGPLYKAACDSLRVCADWLRTAGSSLVAEPIRSMVLARDGGSCRYCGATASGVDHVVPVTVGGPSTADNLVACCDRCNTRKQARAGFRLCRATTKACGNLLYTNKTVSPYGQLYGERLWEYVDAHPVTRLRRFARRRRQRKPRDYEEQG